MAFGARLNRLRKTGKFLDVGCATGFFINGIKNHSKWEVYGVDFGESAVRYARDKLKLDVRLGGIDDGHFPDGFFDYVHVNNVLEHVLDPVLLLKECRRVIKPDGVFFLSVPNGSVDSLDIIDFFRAEQKPGRSVNGHIFFFPARTLLSLLDMSGFEVTKKKTYSFKRGFRSVGHLPRKTNWKNTYLPHESPEVQVAAEIDLPDTKRKHSDFYYKYRFIQGNFQMLPGLHKSGLDFLFLSKPKPSNPD